MVKEENFMLISIVAIVAIVGMVILFTSTRSNMVSSAKDSSIVPVSENVGGQAIRYGAQPAINKPGVILTATSCTCVGGTTFPCPGPCADCCGGIENVENSVLKA